MFLGERLRPTIYIFIKNTINTTNLNNIVFLVFADHYINAMS